MARLIVGNWKMHLNPGEASLLAYRLEEKIAPDPHVEVVICPPFIDIYPIAKQIDKKKLKVGAQNIHYLDEGAVTGEVSAAMLQGLVDYVIVGHSERRAMGEDDKFIAKKMAAALRNNLTPILCVGENLHDREHKLTNKVITDQLTAGLHALTAQDVAEIVIAYEPVWAIGSGVPATPTQIKPVIQAIRHTVEELYGEAGGAHVRVLYGASVEPEFVKSIMTIPGIDGLLVGGASLNYDVFSRIVKAVQSLD